MMKRRRKERQRRTQKRQNILVFDTVCDGRQTRISFDFFFFPLPLSLLLVLALDLETPEWSTGQAIIGDQSERATVRTLFWLSPRERELSTFKKRIRGDTKKSVVTSHSLSSLFGGGDSTSPFLVLHTNHSTSSALTSDNNLRILSGQRNPYTTMALRSRPPANNLEEMRKAVAEKFPAITSLRAPGAKARNGKENNPPRGTTGSMELVVMEPPLTYSFGIRSKHTVAPASSATFEKKPAPPARQVRTR
jgi:hypothetical protein